MKSKIGKLAWNYSYICRLRNIVREMDFGATFMALINIRSEILLNALVRRYVLPVVQACLAIPFSFLNVSCEVLNYIGVSATSNFTVHKIVKLMGYILGVQIFFLQLFNVLSKRECLLLQRHRRLVKFNYLLSDSEKLMFFIARFKFFHHSCEIRDYFYNLVNFCHDIDHGEPPVSECGLGNSHSDTGFVPRQFKMTNNRDAYDVATDVPANVRVDMLKWLVYAFNQDIDFHHATELLTRHINEYRGCLCEGMPYSPIEVSHVWH